MYELRAELVNLYYSRSSCPVCGVCSFLLGWNDGTIGTLLPRIQRVGFVTVSLLFVFTCVGVFLGAMINVTLTDKAGFGKVRSLVQPIAYSVQVAMVPFPAFVFANCINMIGLSVQDARGNGFVAALGGNKNGLSSRILWFTTQFSAMPQWSFHFLVSLGISIVNSILVIFVFRFRFQPDCLAEIGQEPEEKSTSEKAPYRQILNLKTDQLPGLFISTYVGVEVTLGGLIVTFVADVRGGGPSAGYLSSGFLGSKPRQCSQTHVILSTSHHGLMVGCVALLWFNKELVVWAVPSLVAISISLVGVFLGPFYPLAMIRAGRVLPWWLLTGSIGWIGGFGTAGQAFFPFPTGAVVSKEGIRVPWPLVVTMMSLIAIIWMMVPKSARRVE
ncbi:hypothetical protein BS17DRAFT_837480 [Gyrodon lividus]|nr:hypothetical protein BS17DRAFT_837480 [Gyrodon lividus]